MILLDYSQIAISNLHQQLKHNPSPKSGNWTTTPEAESESGLSPLLLRHMVLNSIRKANKEFGKQYGQMVICTDNRNYWRKSEFKYYKANRKKDREDSGIDWTLVFETLNELREELRDNFPYKVMNVPMAEADDIIGVVARHYHDQENILILSGDKDFMQLQVYPHVDQYSPVQDKFMKPPNARLFLKEHIIQGDKGDGIPNFLSPDDVFVTEGTRQSSVTKKKLEVWLTQKPEEFCDAQMLINYRRNEKLVDLSKIPEQIETAILDEFEKPIVGSRDKIYGYFVKNRMRNLMELIREF